jgi:hypothetical protein
MPDLLDTYYNKSTANVYNKAVMASIWHQQATDARTNKMLKHSCLTASDSYAPLASRPTI